MNLVHMSTPYFFKSLRIPIWHTDVFAGRQLSGVRNAERNCAVMFHSHGKDTQVWKATVCNSWFEQAKRWWPYSRKSTSFAMEKLNTGLGIVSDIIAGFGCIKVYAEWMPFQLIPTMKRARLEVKDHIYTFHRNICSVITKWLYIFFCILLFS